VESSKPVQLLSTLLNYLPAVYAEASFGDDAAHDLGFLGFFLLAFEDLLLGRGHAFDLDDQQHQASAPRGGKAVCQPGLEEIIAHVYNFFDPEKTPDEFLSWLAEWAALTFPSGLSKRRQRKLILQIIPLYKIRGTKKYVQTLLNICIGGVPRIDDEELPAMQVGQHSTIGKDTYIGGGAPHVFRVVFALSDEDSPHLLEQQRLAHHVIRLAKPAHTGYHLEIVFPRMQIGTHSTVGFDTILRD
jgi:phage tail-like protein